MLGLVKRYARGGYRRIIRSLMPVSGPALYAGIPVSLDRRFGDRLFGRWLGPFPTEDIPDYELTLVTALRAEVRRGDRVVVVGGGHGVTVAVAALISAPDGKVICFEGAAAQVGRTRETARRNGVADRVTVRHAVVGPADRLYGGPTDAPAVAPRDLPDCDILELDCEGAELAILAGLAIRPRAIIVETHGLFGAPAALVGKLLADLGYTVTDLGIAEPRAREHCTVNDVRVLSGRLARVSGRT